jgi:hypothetical protein
VENYFKNEKKKMVAQKEKVYVHTTTRGSTADWSDIIILSGCDLCGGEKIKKKAPA